ncbi:MAG: thioredoxin domain-containing protein [Sulfuriferula multivorans]|uniref:Thioredoxin domain-containing protein n=1 Tax=Sulfuriferula multivorans TaxID=1559896 RepID=A0A7C9K0Z9_9PROT|nr:thioredoxin domain-containing protein [Sulfuriferula multivorans]
MFGFKRWSAVNCVLLISCLTGAAWSAAPVNQLANHPSPYLALHGSDPVAWQEWNADTLARARRENKLLFVSVGYFACHWCHVMQRESYKNKQIAAILNRDFIPVKVDRELNSGLDDALQNFSARLTGASGWPLNAFVTPEGHPAYVILYAPPDDFRKLLSQLSGRWASDKAGIRRLATQAMQPPAQQPVGAPLTAARTARAWQQFMAGIWQEADTQQGGFGQVSKFPMAPQLDALLERQAKQPDAKLAEFLRLTFDQMAARGMRDHVGGGFFRYTVDPGWDTPHFEKMLYDNAHLVTLYLRAATVLRQPRYRDIARSTLAFMQDELQDASGGFYSSTSAVDAAGREGATYLWEPEELKRRLSPEAYSAAKRVWRLEAARSFDEGYLPAEYSSPTASERRLLTDAARILRPLRQARSLPKDTKLNAGLNGLALSAFSQAISQVDKGYRSGADRLQRFILSRLAKDGRLMKSMARGQILPDAELEDYAYVVQGLLDHADATGNDQSRVRARQIAQTAWQLFWSEQGWKHEAQPLLATLQPEPALADGALYSPSDVLILASLRVQDPVLNQKALNALRWRLPAMERDPYTYPTRVRALALTQPD